MVFVLIDHSKWMSEKFVNAGFDAISIHSKIGKEEKNQNSTISLQWKLLKRLTKENIK